MKLYLYSFVQSLHFEIILISIRSSCSQMFFKVGVLKNFAIFTGEHLCWNLFLIKLQARWPAASLKRDSNAGFFL